MMEYFNIFIILQHIVISFVGIVGNVLVLIVYNNKLKDNELTTFFIIHLAIADLACCIFLIPINCYHELHIEQISSDFMCKFHSFLNIINITYSICLMTLVAFERVFSIIFPLRKIVTKQRAKYIMSLLLALCLLIALLGSLSIGIYHKVLFLSSSDSNFVSNLYYSDHLNSQEHSASNRHKQDAQYNNNNNNNNNNHGELDAAARELRQVKFTANEAAAAAATASSSFVPAFFAVRNASSKKIEVLRAPWSNGGGVGSTRPTSTIITAEAMSTDSYEKVVHVRRSQHQKQSNQQLKLHPYSDPSYAGSVDYYVNANGNNNENVNENAYTDGDEGYDSGDENEGPHDFENENNTLKYVWMVTNNCFPNDKLISITHFDYIRLVQNFMVVVCFVVIFVLYVLICVFVTKRRLLKMNKARALSNAICRYQQAAADAASTVNVNTVNTALTTGNGAMAVTGIESSPRTTKTATTRSLLNIELRLVNDTVKPACNNNNHVSTSNEDDDDDDDDDLASEYEAPLKGGVGGETMNRSSTTSSSLHPLSQTKQQRSMLKVVDVGGVQPARRCSSGDTRRKTSFAIDLPLGVGGGGDRDSVRSPSLVDDNAAGYRQKKSGSVDFQTDEQRRLSSNTNTATKNSTASQTNTYGKFSISAQSSRHRASYLYSKTLLRNLKTVFMLFVVSLIMAIVYTPALLISFGYIPYNPLYWNLVYINNAANPLVYSFLNSNFRKSLKQKFNCKHLTKSFRLSRRRSRKR